jgi:hypothetical protein
VLSADGATSQTPDLTTLADKPLPIALAILAAVLFLASIPYWGPVVKDSWTARIARRAGPSPAPAVGPTPQPVTAPTVLLPPPLSQVVEGGTDYARRYMDSLEQRVVAEQTHRERLQERLDREEKDYYEKLRALEAENAQLRAQLNSMMYGRGNTS